MPPVTFSGLASGIDTQKLIAAILDAERQPLKRLQVRQAVFNQKHASFEELRSKLNAFEGSLRELASDATFRGRTTTVSDESVLRATAGTGAETGLFSLEVLELAAAHRVKSNGVTAGDLGLVADGTITVQSGDHDPITVDVAAASGTNTLESIRDTINAADAGVKAAIIFDGTDYRLTLRSAETGVENALTLTDSTNLGLDQVANLVTTARDAHVELEGISIISSSNRLTRVVPGATLDLLSTTSGTPVTVEIGQDVDSVVEAVQGLVNDYNEVVDLFNTHNNRDNPGVLAGDSTLLRIQLQLQKLFTGGVDGIPLGGIRSLSSVGVAFDGKTGKASLDTAALHELLDTDFAAVGNLFLAAGTPSDPRIRYAGATSATANGEYSVEVTQAAERASVAGSTAILSLQADEDLTVTAGAASVEVHLLLGMQIDEIVAAINAELSDAGLDAYASNDGGKLRVSTKSFGSAAAVSVVSNRSDAADGKSTGFDPTPASDTGVDVAGSIGGVAAVGSGQTLTGAEGEAFAGLLLRVTATPADILATGGDFGTISYTRGLITNVLAKVEDFTRFDDGVIGLASDTLERNLDRLDDDIQRIEKRLVVREAQLRRTFSAAERAISLLQSQQAAVGGFGRG